MVKVLKILTVMSVLTCSLWGQRVAISNPQIEKKVENLLKKMTLKEKIGQMTQVTLEVVSKKRKKHTFENQLDLKRLRKAIVDYGVGSILNTGGAANSLKNWQQMITTMQNMALHETRLGIPIIYGIDAIHGSNYIKEATLFPQSIAMAASWNRKLVQKEGEITAFETRTAGIPWNFNPVLGLGRQPLWPRFWETYGESPYAVAEFGKAYIRGLQGTDNDVSQKTRVAACMKHYAGYSFPLSGHDRTPSWIDERMMRELFLPPFKAAVDAGAYTLMISSSEINGIPSHANKWLLTNVLRDEWGFEGLAVTDWDDINYLHKRDHIASSEKEAVKIAVNAGIDMSMVPFNFKFADYLYELVQEGAVPQKRIDEAVRRILRVKFALGLFDNPFPALDQNKQVGSEEFASESLKAAREVITLLKNSHDLLPLKKDVKILVTGPAANSLPALNGGWTYTWQGDADWAYPDHMETIVQAIQKLAGKENVLFSQGANFTKKANLKETLQKAQQADVIVACIGEDSYCETPGNINDLRLPSAQIELVEQLARTGKPIVLVLVEGRPRIVQPIVEHASAIVMAYLPGPYGGQAIAEVLFGKVNPSGKLPFTYPRYVNDLVPYDHKYSEEYDVNKFNPQWPLGFGLSYSKFVYQNLRLSKSLLQKDDSLEILVDIVNKGDRPGKEAVLLFVSDLYRSITPPVRELKGFTKIYLNPGETKTVRFVLRPDDLSFINARNRRVVEAGEFKVQIGSLMAEFTLQ